MRRIIFTPNAFKEYNEWIQEDFAVVQKIQLLLRDIHQNPFKGLGKPEPLKGDYSGYWSRRITQKDRLIYKVSSNDIELIKCRGHY